MVEQEQKLTALRRFVMISSDKAVRPANIMGATKRLAEILVRAALGPSGRALRFSSVRQCAGK